MWNKMNGRSSINPRQTWCNSYWLTNKCMYDSNVYELKCFLSKFSGSRNSHLPLVDRPANRIVKPTSFRRVSIANHKIAYSKGAYCWVVVVNGFYELIKWTHLNFIMCRFAINIITLRAKLQWKTKRNMQKKPKQKWGGWNELSNRLAATAVVQQNDENIKYILCLIFNGITNAFAAQLKGEGEGREVRSLSSTRGTPLGMEQTRKQWILRERLMNYVHWHIFICSHYLQWLMLVC